MVYVYSPDMLVSSADLTLITLMYWNSLLSFISLGVVQHFSAAEAIHIVLTFVPPGTHYYWIVRGGADLKFDQGFYTWPALRESNPRHLDLGSNVLTTRPRTSPIIIYLDNFIT